MYVVCIKGEEFFYIRYFLLTELYFDSKRRTKFPKRSKSDEGGMKKPLKCRGVFIKAMPSGVSPRDQAPSIALPLPLQYYLPIAAKATGP
jgi:hypothetical protein